MNATIDYPLGDFDPLVSTLNIVVEATTSHLNAHVSSIFPKTTLRNFIVFGRQADYTVYGNSLAC